MGPASFAVTALLFLASLTPPVEDKTCVPSPCHTARWDDVEGRCVEEIDETPRTACRTPCVDSGTCSDGVCVGQNRSCDDKDACTSDRCDSVLGCVSTPLAEQAPCGVATCDSMAVCRAGQCVEEPLAASDADPHICGLDLETVERTADPRRANASLFVRESGEVHLIGDDFFERRTAAGWTDASSLIAGRGFNSYAPAGPDSYWATTHTEVFRFSVGTPAARVCKPDESQLSTLRGTPERVWVMSYESVITCDASGVSTGAGGFEEPASRARVSVCDDGSLWIVDIEGTRHGLRWRDRYNSQNGVCAGDTYFRAGAGLSQWTSDGWLEVGAKLALSEAKMSGTSAADVWMNALGQVAHWDGKRWTRADGSVRAWVSPKAGEAWVLEADGTLVHRRRP